MSFTRLDKSRVIRADRGAELTCANWQIEAAKRMLMNNLDEEGQSTASARRIRRYWSCSTQLGVF